MGKKGLGGGTLSDGWEIEEDDGVTLDGGGGGEGVGGEVDISTTGLLPGACLH